MPRSMLRQCVRLSSLAVLLVAAPFGLAAEPVPQSDTSGDGETVDFARDIQPIFVQHCYDCHGPDYYESGLQLSSRESALAGGDSGLKAIVPGKPEESRLLKVISGQDDLAMPPEDEGERLNQEQIDLLARWIREGAAWPDSVGEREKPRHWAWQKPVEPALPAVQQAGWPRNGIDYFVLARLEREGLRPSPEADRYMLVRRLYLDLIGLPPSPAEVQAFVQDQRPDAYARLVEKLLADPAYGERWARKWLDLARYADSKGYGSDPLRSIWRYRDWVIDALNRNLPYDQFTIEQLAGDLLPQATPDQLLATAFHRNTMSNDEGGTDDEEFRVAAVKDRIETTMQVWMGFTAGCAKCHSHKFDPLTQREYYQLYAFFNQTEDADRGDEQPRLPTPTRHQQMQIDRLASQLAELRRQFETPTPELASAQAAWESTVLVDEARKWAVLELESPSSSNGSALERLPDQSLLAGGPSPESDTYTVNARTELAGITAFKLEALGDEQLPRGGPGRKPDSGGYALSELRVGARADGAPSPSARYVRIELPGTQKILSLAEVQVLRGSENVALAGNVSQSSTDYDAPAELAIDNTTEGDFFARRSVTHTRAQDNPWWEVDLGSTVQIDRVVVWNRTDGDLESRLNGFKILLLDEARKPVQPEVTPGLPDPSLEIAVAGPAPIALANATASLAEEGFAAAEAIDGDEAAESGWSAPPGKPATAVFETTSPLGAGAPTTLTFTLVQSRGGQQTLGRFRLSATTSAPPVRALPDAVREVLALEPASRTPEETASLAAYYRSIAPELTELGGRIAALEGQLKDAKDQVPTTPVMLERAPDQQRITNIMLKGNFLAPGDQVAPAVPAAFHPLAEGAANDRLGLARWLVDDDNPLTARVAVNRFWSQLFGTGLVETEEDVGTQGAAPSHPKLLDWLAVEFQRNWDMKALLRLMVTSATYRQSSTAPAELIDKDPHNRLLARGPRHRLEAEMVRDQALALGGLLSRKVGGPSVYPPQPPGLWRAAFNGDRTWPTSTGEDRYRRGLYTFWRRTVPYPSMAAFDAPSREICTLRRISTNTPLQAFVTLNDPVYVEAAQALARRIVAEGGADRDERIAYGLRLCLAREAQSEQVASLRELYEDALAHYRQDPTAATQLATDPLGPLPAGLDAAEAAAWTVIANVLLNLDGVLTKR